MPPEVTATARVTVVYPVATKQTQCADNTTELTPLTASILLRQVDGSWLVARVSHQAAAQSRGPDLLPRRQALMRSIEGQQLACRRRRSACHHLLPADEPRSRGGVDLRALR